MATRNQIITTIGDRYLTANVEEGEWKYSKAFRSAGKEFVPIKRPNGQNYDRLDLRFECGNISILVETKVNFDRDIEGSKAQLQAYVRYEKDLTGNKSVAILANTSDDRIMVWRGPISESSLMDNEIRLRSFGEYADFYTSKVNDKEQVMRNTYALNELLHGEGIPEKLRSQFVGTCLLALKNGVKYDDRSTPEIIASMRNVLNSLLRGDILRGEKLAIIERKVLEDQSVRVLSADSFRRILRTVETDILPYINDKSTAGQDLLNLFFITFNKYVGKADKNQAFTPDHITDFMTKVCDVNRNSRVLDATCGSGSFLVRAMTQAIDDCATEAEQNRVKQNQIFGIEYDENAFGLATTNMLIHGDGNSNIKQGSCFDNGHWIESQHISVVLMNPPYNATRAQSQQDYVSTWAQTRKEDPSQGFHFVQFVADHVKTGRMAVLLPMQCAIGGNEELRKYKRLMLQEHTLDAVFSLPNDVFHPGAAVQVCCMVFSLGKRHDSTRPTFFGYYKDDGFIKRKRIGRVERTASDGSSVWSEIEKTWLGLYHSMKAVDGLSAVQCVTADDEWLAEAYMKTDYSKLTRACFQSTLSDYLSFLIRSRTLSLESHFGLSEQMELDIQNWRPYKLGGTGGLFEVKRGVRLTKEDMVPGLLPYLGAISDNNCVRDYIDAEPVYEGNTITLNYNGSVGEAFYQPDPYWPSDDVKTLVPVGWELNPLIALFICTLLKQERYRFSYGRKWVTEKMEETELLLPSDSSGKPNWKWIERYMRSLHYSDKIA